MTNPLFPARSFFHGTKANLKHGDLIKAGYNSNYGKRATADYVYLSGTLNAAIWGAELALGEEAGEYTLWNRRDPSKMTPILPTRSTPAIRHCPIVAGIRSG